MDQLNQIATPAGQMPASRRIELVVLLGALTAFAPLSIDMYLPALPAIAHEFGVSVGATEHTLAAFFLGFALGQAGYGPLADRFGRKGPLYGGLALYVLACLGCGLGWNVDSLMVLRFAQAVGACAAVVVARACVRDLFAAQTARILSHMSLVLGVAPLVAPLIGGYLLIWTGWRAIFLLQAAIGAVALLAVWLRLPQSHAGAMREMHPLAILRDYGALLIDRRFVAYALAMAVSSAAMFAYITASPHVFIDLFGVLPQRYGWFFGTNAMGLVAASQLAARLLRHHSSTRILLAAQFVQVICAIMLIGFAITGVGGLWGIAAGLFCVVAAGGAISPTAIALAMAPFGAMAGMASALLGVLQFAAAALASAIVGGLAGNSPIPMASVVAGCAAIALACHLLLAPRAAASS